MRIAFDGSTLRPGRTGVGYYTEHLLSHLAAEIGDRDELVVISNRRPETCAPIPAHVRVATSSPQVVSLAWMQMLAPSLLKKIGADVAHFTNCMIPAATDVPTVVTIHDMSLELYPECHPMRRVLINRPLKKVAARHAHAIVTVSNSAKLDITRIYGLDPDRVHVVHEAAAPHFRPVVDPSAREAIRRRYDLPERFILYVGTIEPRKNLPRLLDAFAARVAKGDLRLPLACVGPYGWLSSDIAERIERLGIRDHVRFLGYVAWEHLPALYSLCDMFVFPSLYEGFGLPVMEAMSCGAPTIVGRNASLMEIAGDAVASVDPLSVEAIGDALATFARDDDHRREMAARGLERAREFSWTKAARQTLDVYRAAIRAAEAARARGPRFAPAITTRAIHPSSAMAATDTAVGSIAAATTGTILLGQAYYLRFDPKLWAARQPYPPLGTLYAAACLRERGHNVSVFDAMLATSEAEWDEALRRERPALAVIYEDSFNYLSKMCLLRMRQAAITMIGMARARGIPVVIAGSDATDCPAEYIDRGASCVILGEGEATLADVARIFRDHNGEGLAGVTGVCYRDAGGLLRRTAPREFIRDLDGLPLPAWDLVDLKRYRDIWLTHHGYSSMNLVTTRGCPYHCNWCAKPIYGQRYAVRSAAHVVRELAELHRAFAPDHLWIADDIFGLTPGWVEQFADLVTAADVVTPFKCLMRADQVTARIATALRRSGCRTVWLGAESGSQRILDAMEKGNSVGDIHNACRFLKDAGIEVGFFLQFGYPGETRSDIDLTLRMLRECRPDDIGISVSYPLPGTRFHERVRAELGHKRNWIDSSDLAAMYHATYSPEFYRALHRAVHVEFRWRRARALARLLKTPARIRRSDMRQFVGAALRALKLPLMRWQLGQLAQTPTRRAEAPRPDVPLADAVPTGQDS